MSAPPLRVVHVINNLPVGGAERFLVLLASAQRQQGLDVEVVALVPPTTLGAALVSHAVPWRFLRSTRLNDPRLVLDLWRYLRRQRPDIVHTHLFYADVCGRVAGRLAGVRIIVGTEHSTEAAPMSWRRRLLLRATAPLASRLVAVSESVRDAAVARLGDRARDMAVIPNGIAVEEWAQAEPLDAATLGLPADAIRIGCVGRLAPEKGLDTVIQAVARTPEKCWHLLLVGDGTERDALQALAHRLQVSDRVHFLGWRTDVERCLRSFDVFAMPSRYEGHSLALLEAMAAGCACVVSNIPELVAQSGGAAWIAAPDDPDRWSRVLQEVIAAPEARRTRGAAAQGIAARASIAVSATAYRDLYARLSRQHAGTAR